MQNLSSFKRKVFNYKGLTKEVLGYEHFALKLLLDAGLDSELVVADDILIDTDMTPIPYEFLGKTHKYFPDICVKKKKYVEVKSPATWMRQLDKNMAKGRGMQNN